MLRIIGRILVVIVVAVGALLIYAATRPDSFHVERSLAIKAPPEKIFPLLADFHKWPSWSPFEKLDPAMARNLSGADSGKGAVYEWSGNGKAGAGRMEITDATAPASETIKLDFTKPFATSNTVTFTLKPDGDSTNVTWAMDGPSPYIAKIMGIFVSMDAMIGKDFESGLANLKAQAEGGQ
jgi:hypothetical protein